MATKQLTKEEEAAIAAEQEAAKAAPAASAQEMSGGVVKPSAQPDAVGRGALAMQNYSAPLVNAMYRALNPLGGTIEDLATIGSAVASEPNAAPYEPALPKAKANFWEQAPAALSDVGHYATQALRTAGNSVSGALNNFAPYTYLRDANRAVRDYFTPPSMQGVPQTPVESVNSEEQQAARSRLLKGVPNWRDVDQEAPSPFPVPAPTYSAPEMLAGEVLRISPTKYQKDVYREDGSRAGYVQGTKEQMDRLTDPRPSEFEQQNQARQQVEDHLFARRIQQEREWQERTSPEAANKFFARVNTERALDDAANRGRSNDPARNAFLVEDILRGAQTLSQFTGKSVDEVLSSPEYARNHNVRVARSIAAQEARSGQPLTTQQIAQQALALAPSSAVNFGGDDETYQESLEKQGATKMNPAVSDQTRMDAEARAKEKAADDSEKARLSQDNQDLRARIAQSQEERAAQQAARRDQNDARDEVNKAESDYNEAIKFASDPKTRMNNETKLLAQQAIQRAEQRVQMARQAARELGLEYPEPAAVQPSAVPSPASIEYLQQHPEQMQKLSSADLQALQWADTNPTDPRAIAIKEKIQQKLGA